MKNWHGNFSSRPACLQTDSQKGGTLTELTKTISVSNRHVCIWTYRWRA